MSCIYCGRGLHDECEDCETCHPKPIVAVTTIEYKDPLSTGRKQAAQLYPLSPSSDCEWKMMKNCGGGLRPIIGCEDGKQKHRHHGPIKDTLRNEEGNVHRICWTCHVRWHELNDLVYTEEVYSTMAHSPVAASIEEVRSNEVRWVSGLMKKEFELASSVKEKK